MIKIKNLTLKSNLILAPMSGVSDLPFRMLNRKFGSELAFVEMINARSISSRSRRTAEMLKSCASDKPLGVQLLGCESKFILKAIDILNNYSFDVLDFNAACPARKVVRRKEGAGLLKNPKNLQKLLKLLVEASKIPVTLKIRSGWDKNSLNAKDIAVMAQDVGVNAVFIHGRTQAQGYSGNVDYDVIREAKKNLNIPVIASGDLFGPELIKRMFDETGCDGALIARGALGNPWIFKDTQEFLKNNKQLVMPKIEEIIKTMIEHLDSCIEFYGERIGIIKFRKFFFWYTRGLRSIRRIREKSSRLKTRDEMLEIANKILELNSK